MFRFHVVHAIFWRNFKQYFTSVLGYLFIFVFVLTCAILTFNQQFFADNLANLDQLSRYFPALLLFFIPAITMTSWADEKKQGTDTILFTLPASDFEILIGKFKAVSAVYAVALLFSGTVLVALARLGVPDWGVVATTYLGYWLAGIALIAIGMFASSLTNSTTVAFVLAAILCAVPVLLGYLVEGNQLLESYGVPGQLRDFAAGMISLPGVVYFVSIAAFMLYLNYVVISRRHWSRGKQVTLSSHFAVRIASLLLALISINVLAERSSGMFNNRVDLTAERLFTLDDTTRATLTAAEENGRAIEIQAFLSPESDIPPRYVNTRKNLVNILRQYDRVGGSNVTVRFVDVLPNSDEVQEAISLKMEQRATREVVGGLATEQDVFMGVRVSSTVDEVTLPFVDNDTSIEYELTRSIASATAEQKKLLIGILETDAHFGNVYYEDQVFDWVAPKTLKKLEQQYDLVRLTADQMPDLIVEVQERAAAENKVEGKVRIELSDGTVIENDSTKEDSEDSEELATDEDEKNIPDVLIVADPSSLSEKGLNSLIEYIRLGQPTLIMADPMPFYWGTYQGPTELGIVNAPAQSRIGQQAAWRVLATSPEPKASGGRATALLDELGIVWKHDRIVWSANMPHVGFKPVLPPRFGDRWPDEYGPQQNLFVFAKSFADHTAFNPGSPISSGLHELMFVYPGSIGPNSTKGDENNGEANAEKSKTNFMPLVTLKPGSAGHLDWDEFTEDYVSTRLEVNPYSGESRTVTSTEVSRFTGFNVRTLRKRPKINRPVDEEKADESKEKEEPASDEGEKAEDEEQRTVLDKGIHVLAAHIQGVEDNKTNVVFIADVDFISDMYYLQKEAIGSALDNHAFFVNAIETLAGDETFVRLRNRRPTPRTLTQIEKMKEPYKLDAVAERDKAESEFNKQLDDARKRAERKEKSLAEDTEMSESERTQQRLFSQLNEESKLSRQDARIQLELEKTLSNIKGKEEADSRRVEARVRWLSILSAGLPALLLGSLVLCYRTLREQRNIDPQRRVKKN